MSPILNTIIPQTTKGIKSLAGFSFHNKTAHKISKKELKKS